MRRRQFLGFTAAALASLAPTGSTRASSPPRIGWLWSGRSAYHPNEVKGFQQGLLDLGYIEGKNIVVEYRFGEGSEDPLKNLAEELVRLPVDVLVAIGPASQVLRDTGTAIPIVALTGDLVGDHLVDSLARPGGTITGISFMAGAAARTLTGKRLQLLKEAAPAVTRVGYLFNSKYATSAQDADQAERIAPKLSMVVHPSSVLLIEEVKSALARLKHDGVEAIIVDAAPPLITHQQEVAGLALEFQLSAVSEQPEFAEYGGLLSYGPSIFAVAERQAYYVDRILKGSKPADLPAEEPAKFELVINLKTAKVLGLTVPPLLVAQADKVIE